MKPFYCAFFSHKGGVGRSTTAANIAWQLTQLGKTVVIIDLDFAASGIDLIPELKPNKKNQLGIINLLLDATKPEKVTRLLEKENKRNLLHKYSYDVTTKRSKDGKLTVVPVGLRTNEEKQVVSDARANLFKREIINRFINLCFVEYDYIIMDVRPGDTWIPSLVFQCIYNTKHICVICMNYNKQIIDATLSSIRTKKLTSSFREQKENVSVFETDKEAKKDIYSEDKMKVVEGGVKEETETPHELYESFEPLETRLLRICDYFTRGITYCDNKNLPTYEKWTSDLEYKPYFLPVMIKSFADSMMNNIGGKYKSHEKYLREKLMEYEWIERESAIKSEPYVVEFEISMTLGYKLINFDSQENTSMYLNLVKAILMENPTEFIGKIWKKEKDFLYRIQPKSKDEKTVDRKINWDDLEKSLESELEKESEYSSRKDFRIFEQIADVLFEHLNHPKVTQLEKINNRYLKTWSIVREKGIAYPEPLYKIGDMYLRMFHAGETTSTSNDLIKYLNNADSYFSEYEKAITNQTVTSDDESLKRKRADLYFLWAKCLYNLDLTQKASVLDPHNQNIKTAAEIDDPLKRAKNKIESTLSLSQHTAGLEHRQLLGEILTRMADKLQFKKTDDHETQKTIKKKKIDLIKKANNVLDNAGSGFDVSYLRAKNIHHLAMLSDKPSSQTHQNDLIDANKLFKAAVDSKTEMTNDPELNFNWGTTLVLLAQCEGYPASKKGYLSNAISKLLKAVENKKDTRAHFYLGAALVLIRKLVEEIEKPLYFRDAFYQFEWTISQNSAGTFYFQADEIEMFRGDPDAFVRTLEKKYGYDDPESVYSLWTDSFKPVSLDYSSKFVEAYIISKDKQIEERVSEHRKELWNSNMTINEKYNAIVDLAVIRECRAAEFDAAGIRKLVYRKEGKR